MADIPIENPIDEDLLSGDLILILGDMHIPFKTQEIPSLFKELLIPNKFQHVICTGSIGSKDSLEYIRTLSKNCHIVKGEYEEVMGLSDNKILQAGKYKLGIVHGHQIVPWGDEESLNNYMREFDVDIIISGHTHDAKLSKYDGKFFVNPGSITGVYGPIKFDVEPSFALLEIKDKSIDVYFYKIDRNNELIIEKATISKLGK